MDLTPIVCVVKHLEQRENGETNEFVGESSAKGFSRSYRRTSKTNW